MIPPTTPRLWVKWIIYIHKLLFFEKLYAKLNMCLWGVSPIRLILKLKAGTTKIPLFGGIFVG